MKYKRKDNIGERVIVMVAKYLGHTKIDETLNTYSHMYRNKLDDIVNTIDKLDE